MKIVYRLFLTSCQSGATGTRALKTVHRTVFARRSERRARAVRAPMVHQVVLFRRLNKERKPYISVRLFFGVPSAGALRKRSSGTFLATGPRGSVKYFSQNGLQALAREKSASNGGILNGSLQVLHVHVFLVTPLGTGYMAQPGTDQHEGGVAVRETAHYTSAAADLPVQPFNTLLRKVVCQMGGVAPFGNPHKKRRYATPPRGAYRLFLLSSPPAVSVEQKSAWEWCGIFTYGEKTALATFTALKPPSQQFTFCN